MIKVLISNDYSKKLSFSDKNITELISLILDSNCIKEAEVSIVLTNQKKLSDLKKKYFNVNQFTDVITFDISDNKDCMESEIYISIDDVKENSEIYFESFNKEFQRILIHGVLHLLGFDDKTKGDKKKMRLEEEKYLMKFNKKLIN